MADKLFLDPRYSGALYPHLWLLKIQIKTSNAIKTKRIFGESLHLLFWCANSCFLHNQNLCIWLFRRGKKMDNWNRKFLCNSITWKFESFSKKLFWPELDATEKRKPLLPFGSNSPVLSNTSLQMWILVWQTEMGFHHCTP